MIRDNKTGQQVNHECRNKNCPDDGIRFQKYYYSCDYCAATESYRKIACSPECYKQAMIQWLDANPKVNPNTVEFLIPIEIGKTKEETKQRMAEIKNKPLSQVEAETKADLTSKGYGKQVEELGITGTVDLINDEIKTKQATNKLAHTEITKELPVAEIRKSVKYKNSNRKNKNHNAPTKVYEGEL